MRWDELNEIDPTACATWRKSFQELIDDPSEWGISSNDPSLIKGDPWACYDGEGAHFFHGNDRLKWVAKTDGFLISGQDIIFAYDGVCWFACDKDGEGLHDFYLMPEEMVGEVLELLNDKDQKEIVY